MGPEFTQPLMEYASIWPLFVVFGVACLGLLAEAFLPRERRHAVQVVLAVAGLLAALVGTVLIGMDLEVDRGRRRARPDRCGRVGRRRRPDRLHLGDCCWSSPSVAWRSSPSAASRAGSRPSPARPQPSRAPRPSVGPRASTTARSTRC